MLRNQIESFTKYTRLSLGHVNWNKDTLYEKNAFLQNELTEKNKIIKPPNGNPNSHARCNDNLT